MPALMNKRSMIVFYSDPEDMSCHQVRIVLEEKCVIYENNPIESEKKPKELKELSPYNTLPVLVDRELVLYHPQIIMEYLDERFPHPPLLPVYPVLRAKSRLMIYRIERDWFSLVNKIKEGTKSQTQKARRALGDSILSMTPAFTEKPYFFSDEFSLVDCFLAPFFWRLPSFGIELPKHAKAILAYQKRIFNKPSFKSSLTQQERELRSDYSL
ncbi:MAG: glutathione S-transferase N-terminal domain-containing protein [Gammaproteobacteria bacterium]|nr:glutathione S-transferase N-terminal domain-containing protein [Gammaproteobacteria bacterium]